MFGECPALSLYALWFHSPSQESLLNRTGHGRGGGLEVLSVVFVGFVVCGRFCGVGGDEKYYRQSMVISKK